MQNTILGFLIIIIGAMSTLEQLGLIEILGRLTFLYAIALTLVGLLLVLRAQGKMAAEKAERKAVREQEKVTKRLAAEHEAKEKELQKELVEKQHQVDEQEEVIDDMINPKQSL